MKQTNETFYITTPIYYANDKPHIGHAYTSILVDVINRYKQLQGMETWFLTGTDEHGQKVQQAAKKRNLTPKEHVDQIHIPFKEMCAKLDIQYNRFIRTTDPDHIEFVKNAMQDLYDKNEIYAKNYQGWYSVGEERFFSEDELIDGKDPVSGKEVEWLEEKNYFFKMSSYQEKLIGHIQSNPDFIVPDFRKNEVLGFLNNPLKDLCISRPKARLEWGIELPFDKDYVIYVWFDALLNYQSGVDKQTFKNGKSVWPADYHVIGKDILTTHCVYWPTMLMGMQRELPRHILAHGWWLLKDKKMSKSEGNVINPFAYLEKHGTDKLRYFLIREMTIGQDASFYDELFVNRTNTDLANDLGNAISRVNKFVHANFNSILPIPGLLRDDEKAFQKTATDCIIEVESYLLEMKLSLAMESILTLIRTVNKYIDTQAPWKISKIIKDNESDTDSKKLLSTILYTAAEGLRLALTMLWPVIPTKAMEGLEMLGIKVKLDKTHLKWGVLQGGETLGESQILFPRIETKKQNNQTSTSHPVSLLAFKVAQIKGVEDHPTADSLFVLKVSCGDDERTVCAGIKNSYSPQALLDKKVVLLANLKPAKLRGIQSEGMLLAADMDNDLCELIDPGEMAIGSLLGFEGIPVEPKKQVNIKDFQKIELIVKDNMIWYENKRMHFNKDFVNSAAKDGARVR